MNDQNFCAEKFGATLAENEKQRKRLRESLKKRLADVEVPLETRWKEFEKFGSVLETESYVPGFQWERKYGEIFWYDDFGVERYSTFEYADMFEYSGGEKIIKKFGQKAADELKEEILQKGYRAFEYDW